MQNPKKFLIIAPSWVGDLVMSQSLLKLLKKQNPNCSIDVFANKNLHKILEHMPEVDNYLISPFEHGELKLSKRFMIAKELRKNFYTHAYILPNSFKSALIPFWANIPIRTGWIGEFRYILLNKIKTSVKKIPLMVDRFVSLGITENEQLPKLLPKLHVTKEQLDSALKHLEITIPQKPILAICPGAEYGPTKQWPAKHFAQLAQTKKNEGWNIWIFGGPKDKIIAQEIQTQSNNICIDFTGKTNLSEAVSLLSLTTAVVTNDSGLMHIAAALDLPLVAIYGSSSPKFTPPLTNKAKILSLNLPCSPCFKRECPLKHTKCLYDLPQELVLQTIDDLTPHNQQGQH